jgi:hypothetical protein
MTYTYYKAGSWNAVCDVCGRQHKAEDIQKRWDGLMVCKEDYETRHPMDFLRVREDDTTVPWVRLEPTDVFVGPACPFPAMNAQADMGTADCAVVGYTPPGVVI